MFDQEQSEGARPGNAPDLHGPAVVLRQILLRYLNSGLHAVAGMNAHIGVDADTRMVHTVTTTATNVVDVVEVAELPHCKETTVYAAADSIGAENLRQSAGENGISRARKAAAEECPKATSKRLPSTSRT
jgi:IS5 family transposase